MSIRIIACDAFLSLLLRNESIKSKFQLSNLSIHNRQICNDGKVVFGDDDAEQIEIVLASIIAGCGEYSEYFHEKIGLQPRDRTRRDFHVGLLNVATESVFADKITSFRKNFPAYASSFDEFWKAKHRIENDGGLLIDNLNIAATIESLRSILGSWQWYRPFGLTNLILKLSEKLNMSQNHYANIRNLSLINLPEVSSPDLKSMYANLDAVKNTGLMPICKVLMLLWGQTLPFDSRNRKNMQFNGKDYSAFYGKLIELRNSLNQNKALRQCIENDSAQRYGPKAIVPYGRYIDMYYF